MEMREKIELPELFVEKMKYLLGEEFPDFIESYKEERRFGLRINPLKEQGELPDFIVSSKKIPWTEEGFYYDPDVRPGKHPFHEAGLYYIQEPSAMAVTEALKPRPGENILDLCAAPGGKTTHIAGKMGGAGLLVSNEIHPARARILSQNVERMGIVNTVVLNEDPVHMAPLFPAFFDGIVVDAPCSGEGMFRKDENARTEWSPEHVRMCADRQDNILDCAVSMLSAGGRIVYSTCTFSPEENEGTIARFLLRHPDFKVERPVCAEWFSNGRPEWAGGLSCLGDTVRIWPHKAEGEGHFLALLVRTAHEDEIAGGFETNGVASFEKNDGYSFERIGENSRKKNNIVNNVNSNIRNKTGNSRGKKNPESQVRLDEFQEFCHDALCDPERFTKNTASGPACSPISDGEASCVRLMSFGDNLYRIPAQAPSLDGLKVLRPGLHLGTIKKGRFEPSHALALALRKDEVKLFAGLKDGETAFRYLRGEALDVQAVDCGDPKGKGWVLMTFCGYSLGWAKLSGGVLKNHYPKGLRIP